MSDEYFKKALANFTNDFASGGAIRHLADNGFTVKEIHARLDFPTPMSKVAETVWNHFLDKGIILTQGSSPSLLLSNPVSLAVRFFNI